MAPPYHIMPGVYVQRLPNYPTYELRWEQPVVRSAGADTFAHAPYLQELLIHLSWPSASLADKNALEYFFSEVAIGMTGGFAYWNPVTHPDNVLVRWADSTLPAVSETAWQRYKIGFSLRVQENFAQMDAPVGSPTFTPDCFIIGTVVTPSHVAQRPATGYSLTVPQTLERDSAGANVVYMKSRSAIRRHNLDLVFDAVGFAALKEFFFSYTHGQHRKFTWVDWDGVEHSVRLAEPRIVVQQTGCNRFTAGLPLIEEEAVS